MSAGTVVVSSRSFGSGDDDPTADVEAAGHEVVRIDPAHDLDTVAASLADAVGWIAGTGPVTADHLAVAPHLRVVARYGVGVDAVDLAAATGRGVVVTNTPGANADAVADHTIGLMLAVLREVVAGDAAVRAGDWSRRRGRELGACTVGIVGFGAVGRAVARRLAGFGSDVLVHDPYLDDVGDAAVRPVDLPTLLAEADVVSLHAPGGSRPLVDADALAAMRPDAVLVNVARASLVDEVAVADALAAGRLGGHASDVVAAEHGASSPLLDAPRTVLTPHVAGQTVQAIDRMGRAATDDLLRVLAGQPPRHPVVATASP
ncbi:phosphoglycerate dehydrogenase [Nitriliruptoraceae bacterium ZYF776]|nr:phosphoglycerate dehydrogenase [Profundirhabdus halotolerans]